MQAKRLQALEDEMKIANEEYIAAVNRASQSLYSCLTSSLPSWCRVVDTLHIFPQTEALHAQIDGVLKTMLSEDEFAAEAEVEGPG